MCHKMQSFTAEAHSSVHDLSDFIDFCEELMLSSLSCVWSHEVDLRPPTQRGLLLLLHAWPY